MVFILPFLKNMSHIFKLKTVSKSSHFESPYRPTFMEVLSERGNSPYFLLIICMIFSDADGSLCSKFSVMHWNESRVQDNFRNPGRNVLHPQSLQRLHLIKISRNNFH